jgi:hypothetical protein
VQADFTGGEIDLLVDAGLAHHAGVSTDLQVHHAVIAKAVDRLAGLCALSSTRR